MSDKPSSGPLNWLLQAVPLRVRAVMAGFLLALLAVLLAVAAFDAYAGRGVDAWGLKIPARETSEQRACRLMTQAAAANPVNGKLASLRAREDDLERQIGTTRQQCLAETAKSPTSYPDCTTPSGMRRIGRASMWVYPAPLPDSSEKYQAVLSQLDEKLKVVQRDISLAEETQKRDYDRVTQQCSGLKP